MPKCGRGKRGQRQDAGGDRSRTRKAEARDRVGKSRGGVLSCARSRAIPTSRGVLAVPMGARKPLWGQRRAPGLRLTSPPTSLARRARLRCPSPPHTHHEPVHERPEAGCGRRRPRGCMAWRMVQLVIGAPSAVAGASRRRRAAERTGLLRFDRQARTDKFVVHVFDLHADARELVQRGGCSLNRCARELSYFRQTERRRSTACSLIEIVGYLDGRELRDGRDIP